MKKYSAIITSLLFIVLVVVFWQVNSYPNTYSDTELQSVAEYASAHLMDFVTEKPVLGAPAWLPTNIYFYKGTRAVIIVFEDGHLTGGVLGTFSIENELISISPIKELTNAGHEKELLEAGYELDPRSVITFSSTSSGIEKNR